MISGRETDFEAVCRALDPSAVTIVGATEKSPITGQLLGNLLDRRHRFKGPINLVNRSGAPVLGIEVATNTSAIANPGLVYLLIPGPVGAAALEAFAGAPDGVVLYPDASRSAHGYEREIGNWAARKGVAVFGPQSNGVVSARANLVGLLLPVSDALVAGKTSILAQSGGVLGTIVKSALQVGIGIDVAVEYGTGAVWDIERLALAILARADTKALALHIEDVPSLTSLLNIGRRALQLGKRLVLLLAGTTSVGSTAAASHSGAAATPRGVVRDMMGQCGAIYTESLDDLVTSLSALDSTGHEDIPGPGVLVVSDSGGGAVLMADALEHAAIPLSMPRRQTREAVAAATGAEVESILNPYDFGGGNIADHGRRQVVLDALVGDSSYGLCVLVSTLGLPIRERTLHIKHVESFIATVTAAGKVPIIAVPGPLQMPDQQSISGLGRFVLGRGTESSVFAIRALVSACGNPRVTPVSASPEPSGTVAPVDETGATRLASLSDTARLLADLPVNRPLYVMGSDKDLAEEAASVISPPYVVKAELNLAHRAMVGGVLRNIANTEELRLAVGLLRSQFKTAVSVHAQIRYGQEYFVGAARTNTSETIVLVGLGGAVAESTARALLVPFDESEASRIVARFVSEPEVGRRLTSLLCSVQDLVATRPGLAALDLNPVVSGPDGSLWALDAKVHMQADDKMADGDAA